MVNSCSGDDVSTIRAVLVRDPLLILIFYNMKNNEFTILELYN